MRPFQIPFFSAAVALLAMAAFVFVDANGLDLTASEAEFERTVFQVAAGSVNKEDLTDWLRAHIRPRR